MENTKDDQDLPKRHSLRLPGYDYTSTGAYFFTINVQKRKHFFEIPELHRSLIENWQALPIRFPGVTLDVVMPEHVHGILLARPAGEASTNVKRGARSVQVYHDSRLAQLSQKGRSCLF